MPMSMESEVYITANIFAHNRDLDGVEEYFRELEGNRPGCADYF